jgi:hypothetical protein
MTWTRNKARSASRKQRLRAAMPGASGADLRLANLTGTSLLLLGGHVELCGTTNYALTKKWARALIDDFCQGFEPEWEKRLLTDEQKKRRRPASLS